jgi:hypothetical protein
MLPHILTFSITRWNAALQGSIVPVRKLCYQTYAGSILNDNVLIRNYISSLQVEYDPTFPDTSNVEKIYYDILDAVTSHRDDFPHMGGFAQMDVTYELVGDTQDKDSIYVSIGDAIPFTDDTGLDVLPEDFYVELKKLLTAHADDESARHGDIKSIEVRVYTTSCLLPRSGTPERDQFNEMIKNTPPLNKTELYELTLSQPNYGKDPKTLPREFTYYVIYKE